MKTSLVAGLDIGTRTIKMALARRAEERDALEVVGIAEEPSSGVRKGTVVNSEELAQRIAQVKARLEQMTSSVIDEAVVNLGGSHVFIASSRGIVAVSRADGQVSREDVDRVLQAAQALSLSPNYEVLDVFPQQFIVDGEQGIREVVGMRGVRLEAEVLAICSFAPYQRNLQNAMLAGGLEIADIVPTPIATSAAVLTPDQKELGVAMVEIGAGTTGLAVYEEGELLHTATFPVGSNNITNDIAIGLRTEPEIAERIKQEFGTCIPPKGKKMEKVELPDGTQLSFSRKFLGQVIEARVKEILQLVNGELKKAEKQGKLPAGVVLAGGGVKLEQMAELAKRELKLPSKIGVVEGIAGFPQEPSYSCVAGLLLSGTETAARSSKAGRQFGILKGIKKLLKSFIP